MPLHSGLINLHKPGGISSRQAVDVVKRLVRPAKTGHAGTLDPLASGVLVVCVGAATRLIEYVQQMPKRYTGTFLLGRSSPTDDIEGELATLPDPPRPALDEIVRAVASLTGEILQRPPAYSALKVEGRRAYDLARKGHEVDLAPRRVSVYRLDVVRYEYPELVLAIECGTGTYVRALGRDLAQLLGTAAVMSALVRTAIGAFQLADACHPEQLTPDGLNQWLLPPARAVERLARVELTPAEAARLRQGIAIGRTGGLPAVSELAAFAPGDELVAIVELQADGSLRPTRVLVRGDS
ncbi:MAG TPA: tRNA pseudouridine(55) synthase TruB [Pirellulales bacterium]|nr:tRNA pseudouridine(55) synthase TruB [Pirellulales bacterium]